MSIVGTPAAHVQPKGFTKAPNAILEDARLNAHDKLVAIAVASHAWGDEAVCFAGNKRLARLTSLSVRAVQRSLARLHTLGIIPRAATEGTRKNATNRVLTVGWKLDAPETPRDSGPGQSPQVSHQTPPCQSVIPPMSVSHPPHVSQSPEEDPGDSDSGEKTQQQVVVDRRPNVSEGADGGGIVVAGDPQGGEKTPPAESRADADADIGTDIASALRAIERNPEAEPQHMRRVGRLLAKGLRDQKNQGYYRKIANEVNLGARPAQEVIIAFDNIRRKMAAGETRNPGAYFTTLLKGDDQERERRAAVAAAAPSRSPEPPKSPQPPVLKVSSSCEEIVATLRWFVGAGERATPAIVESTAKGLRRTFSIHQNSRFQPNKASQARPFVAYAAALCRAIANGTLSWEHVRKAFAQAQEDSISSPGMIDGQRLGEALLERVTTWS